MSPVGLHTTDELPAIRVWHILMREFLAATFETSAYQVRRRSASDDLADEVQSRFG
jgi:hypothetical protein